MLIEYKIKFEKDGVTVTQRVEPNASNQRQGSSVVGKPTFSKLVGDKVGDGFVDDPTTGGGGPDSGSGRVVAFGPLVFCDSDGTGVVLQGKDIAAEKKKQAHPPAPVVKKKKR